MIAVTDLIWAQGKQTSSSLKLLTRILRYHTGRMPRWWSCTVVRLVPVGRFLAKLWEVELGDSSHWPYMGPMSTNIFFSETTDPYSYISYWKDAQVMVLHGCSIGSCWMIFSWTLWLQSLTLYGPDVYKHLLLWNCWPIILDIIQEWCPDDSLARLFDWFRLDDFWPRYEKLNLVIAVTDHIWAQFVCLLPVRWFLSELFNNLLLDHKIVYVLLY